MRGIYERELSLKGIGYERETELLDSMQRDAAHLAKHYKPKIDNYLEKEVSDFISSGIEDQNPGMKLFDNYSFISSLGSYALVYGREEASKFDIGEKLKRLFLPLSHKDNQIHIDLNIRLARTLTRLDQTDISDLKTEIENYPVTDSFEELNLYRIASLCEILPHSVQDYAIPRCDISQAYTEKRLGNRNSFGNLFDLMSIKIIHPDMDITMLLRKSDWTDSANVKRMNQDFSQLKWDTNDLEILLDCLEFFKIISADEIILTDHGIECINHPTLQENQKQVPSMKFL